jgi:hypothetical protein
VESNHPGLVYETSALPRVLRQQRGSEGTSRTCNEQRVTTAPACHMPTSEKRRRLDVAASAYPRRRPVALEAFEHRHAALSIVKERETHVPGGHTCPVLVSEPGVEPGLRDSESRVLPIGRFRNCRRSGGNCTRAARSKSPACRFNTSDREVGSEGVKPSPRRVKAGHASLHFDPVLLSFTLAFSFALHGHTSNTRC